ncbi:MAG: DNA/RNA nuclease SfsA [Deltaproteobacteria bacterium]|nr:DNA/RNA nuclease SfsA [Deltaproteobacteria bacterium]
MKFEQKLQPAIFQRRYKRFLVDVLLPDNQQITVYCPNTGRMTTCLRQGCDVLLSRSDNLRRKYKYTLELTRPGSCWIGVNTGRTNALVAEALRKGIIRELVFTTMQAEIKVSAKSRLDFLLHNDDDMTYIEVKNCTLAQNGSAMFPDAVTARGTRHLRELMRLRENGHGAVIFFCVQRADADCFIPADHVDYEYGKTLRQAARAGVQVLAYQADVRPDGVDIYRKIPISM